MSKWDSKYESMAAKELQNAAGQMIHASIYSIAAVQKYI